MNAWPVTIFILMFSVISNAQGLKPRASSFSYEDLPRLVKEKNENVQAARSTVKANEERTGRLARSFFPHFSAQLGSEEFKTGSDPLERQEYWKLEASINLYRGGRDQIENEIRTTNVQIAQSDFSREYNQELKEARQSYWKLIAITKIIEDRKEGLQKNEAHLKSSRRRSGAGISTGADTLQFELHDTMLRQDLKKLELQQDLLKNQLSVALGIDNHEDLNIGGEFPHPDEDKSSFPPLNIAEQLDVKNLQRKQQIEKFRNQQTGRWWTPRLDLYSSYGLPSLSDEYTRAVRRDKEWAAGIRVGFDLGQSLEDRSESRARRMDAESVSQRAAHRSREAIASDHELRHDSKLLHELIHDADKDVEKAERFLKLTESEYTRGVKNGPDLLAAFQKFYEFRQRRTELYKDYYEAQTELMSLLAKEENL
jgi:outer membrane protein